MTRTHATRPPLVALAADLRDDVRRARRAPGFPLVMILTLGLTLGAAITTLSLLNALALRDLPVSAPGELVAVSVVDARGTRGTFYSEIANALTARQQTFAIASNYNCCGVLDIRVGAEQSNASLGVVLPTFFDLLGIRPALGRFFTAADVNESAVVINHDLWRRRFDSDPDVVGKTMGIGATTAVIIGVTPREFAGLNIDAGMSMTVLPPLARRISPTSNVNQPFTTMYVIGRLTAGVTARQAEERLATIWPEIRNSAVPASLTADVRRAVLDQQMRFESVRNGFSTLRTRYAAGLRMLAALALALVVVATINLGGLSLARLTRKRDEFAVRLALGASRARLMRSLVAEHLLLSAGGGVLGTALAWMLCRLFASQVWGGTSPMALSVTPDARVVAGAAVLAVVCGAVVSLVPCWVILRRDIATLDRPALSASRKTARAARALMATQTALALGLACVTALFAKSAVQLATADLGFVTDDVVLGRITSRPGGYTNFDPAAYYPELVARLERLPGATSAALSKTMPSPVVDLKPVARRGEERGRNEISAAVETVSPRFFETLGIRVLQGREFTWRDDIRAPGVAIISTGLAERLFGAGTPALGHRVRIGEEAQRADLEIVGIVNDIRHHEFRTAAQPAIYRPWLQEPVAAVVPLFLLKRPQPRLDATMREVRQVVDELARETPPLAIISLRDQVARGQLRERLLGEVSVGVAALALLLTFVGLTALMLQAVATRTREIGLRKALGATESMLARAVALDGCRLMLIGVLLGLPLAFAGGRMARTLLVDVVPNDPVVIVSVSATFILLAIAASLLPARRAARVDPIVALRAR